MKIIIKKILFKLRNFLYRKPKLLNLIKRYIHFFPTLEKKLKLILLKSVALESTTFGQSSEVLDLPNTFRFSLDVDRLFLSSAAQDILLRLESNNKEESK